MARRFLMILTNHNLPQIWQAKKAEPSTINEKTIADFTRVLDDQEIEYRKPQPDSED